jgi:thymidylate kinase
MSDNLFNENSLLATEVLQKLSEYRSDFAVMTGFRRLPVLVKGDVDICCYDAHSVLMSIEKIINDLGGVIGHILPNKGNGYVISGAVSSRGWATFRFDLCETPLLASNRTYPAKYLSESVDSFLEEKGLVNGVYCVPCKMEVAHYVKRKVLKYQFDSEVVEYIKLLAKEIDDLDQIIDQCFTGEARWYYKDFLEVGTIVEHKKTIVFQNLTTNLAQSGKVSFEGKISRLRRVLKKVCSPRQGVHIAFAAPDGAGKTTVIDKIMQRGGMFGSVSYFHLRPTLIPAVSAKSRSDRENLEFKPHTNKPYYFPWNVLKYLALFVDYTLGYYLKIFKQLYSPNLVISDRYFYDIFIDPKRFRLRGSPFFLYFFKLFMPSPDVCYTLIGDPEVLFQRKNDLTVTQIAEQNGKLELLSAGRQEMVLIDANMEEEQVFDAVFTDLLTRISSNLKV